MKEGEAHRNNGFLRCSGRFAGRGARGRGVGRGAASGAPADPRGSQRRHRLRQNEQRLKAGAYWEDNDLVFTNAVGRPLSPDVVDRGHFKPLLQRAGLPDIRMHDLRHTAATLLLQNNVHPKYVAETLGHANIAITLNTYSHVLPNMGDVVADAMGRALG